MPLRLFAYTPPLDETSIEWIFAVFDWALTHLDASVFQSHTPLLTPSNAYFPGRATNTEELAELMFGHTLAYSGMQHWPILLAHPGERPVGDPTPGLIPAPLRRFDQDDSAHEASSAAAIRIRYEPQLIKNPEAMIAGFAQILAHYLGSAVPHSPPGGIQNWAQTTELLGVFLGFGVLFANTAFNFRTSACGSCSGPPAERQVFLSQYDITYALALFCTLKEIPNSVVLPPLKRSLRGYLKRCRKDIKRHSDLLLDLKKGLERAGAEGQSN